MKLNIHPLKWLVSCAAACALGLFPASIGKSVDNFDDNDKAGWEEFKFHPSLGATTVANGQWKMSITTAQAVFYAATRTPETYVLEEGKTIELRSDLVSGNNDNAYAVLGWFPTSAQISSLSGYGIAKTGADILITKGINKYFHEETPAVRIKHENVTLVLILRMAGGNVHITGKVLDRDANNAVLFEKTYIDTPGADILVRGTDDPAVPYTGPGRLTLLNYADYTAALGNVYEVTFDNTEAFVLENIVVDNFNDNTITDWAPHTFGAGAATEANGQFTITLPPAGQSIFYGRSKTSRNFEFLDGEKIEFRVDLLSASRADAFAVLAWIPNTEDVKSLKGYGLTLAAGGFLMSKGINKYFFEEAPPSKTANVTMALTLERRGTSVVGNGRIFDKDANDALIFERTFVDTAGADILANGVDDPAVPFSGPGRFVLILYEDFNQPLTNYEIVLDNALAAAPPILANLPASILEVSPESYRNFVAPTANISFKVSDDKPVPAANVSVTLNGQKFTTANGLTVTQVGNVSTVTLGGLTANQNYTALLEVKDADNANSQTTLYFDTFAKSNLLIEAEDYNFDIGYFIDNPVPVPVDGFFDANGYRYQQGVANADYFSTRTAVGGAYRPDSVSHQASLDYARDPYVAAGGSEQGFVDYDNVRIRATEWQRYTRTFPAGTYKVYLRQAYFNVPTGEVILEKVNGEPGDIEAPIEALGSFIGFNSGAQYRNVPLTDAAGANAVVVNLDGRTTLRLRQMTSDPDDGDIFQNYLIFVPTAPVVNRPSPVTLTPAARSTSTSTDLQIGAVIQDRDTTVNQATVELFVNDSKVNASVTTLSSGKTAVNYNYTPLPPSGSTMIASLRFTDSAGVRVTNDWSFMLNYRSLDAGNRVSSAITPGFNVRLVQAPAGSALADSLQRAEDQLASNSTIPEYIDTTATADVINYSGSLGGGSGYFQNDNLFPGLNVEENGSDDFAVEATAYLQLPAGGTRFGVRSDDGFKLSAGSTLSAQTPIIDFRNSATADQVFDVYVPVAGFYPVRLLYYERGGDQHVEFFTVNTTTGERTLINAEGSTVKAFRELGVVTEIVTLYSSATVDGTFTPETSAIVDSNAKTITIPTSGSSRFYIVRSSAVGAIKIKSVAIQGANVVMTYGAP